MSDIWDEMDGVGDRVEREARREQEAIEAEARQLHLASRKLTDVAWEAMQQGQRVRLRWPGGDLAGVPIAAVEDLIVLPSDDGAIGVNALALASVETTSEKAGAGSAGDRSVESFTAWCRMIENQAVQVSLLGGRTVDGTLVAVAADHLLVRAKLGNEVALADDQVVAVSVAGEPFLAL